MVLATHTAALNCIKNWIHLKFELVSNSDVFGEYFSKFLERSSKSNYLQTEAKNAFISYQRARIVLKFPHLRPKCQTNLKQTCLDVFGSEDAYLDAFCFLNNNETLIFVKQLAENNKIWIY